MNRVALINMPWGSIKRGSIALALLKRVLRRHKIPADVFYFNIRLARRMNLNSYEKISERNLIGDWLFSQFLFGRFGSGELPNSYSDIASDKLSLFERSVAAKIMIDRIQIDSEEIFKIIPPFLEECLNSVRWSDYAVVGFTSVFTQHTSSLLLAQRIKKQNPQIKIVFGGANVHGPMGKAALRAFEWIDYVVDAEAEETFPRLVRNIFDGNPYEKIPGVSFRDGNSVSLHNELPPMVSLNRMPIPDYTEYFSEIERSGLKEKIRSIILFEGARGCWWGEKHHCTFCGLNGQLMKFRSKHARRVLRELRIQKKRHQTSLFECVDNIMDMRYFATLLPELARNEGGNELFYEVKSNLKRDQVDLLAAAGVKFIQPGIESLHSDVLELMRKGVSAIQNVQLLKWCKEKRIRAAWNLLYGFPGEKKAYYSEILERMNQLTHLQPPESCSKIDVQRFSPYHNDFQRWGIRNVRPMALYYYIYPESRVNLDNLAYHFEYSLPKGQPSADFYIQPILDFVEKWKSVAQSGSAVFEFESQPDALLLRDTRRGSDQERNFSVTGLTRQIFEYCETIRPLKEILNNAISTNRVDEEEVLAVLGDLVLKKLLFVEGNRYLNLALPAVAANSAT